MLSKPYFYIGQLVYIFPIYRENNLYHSFDSELKSLFKIIINSTHDRHLYTISVSGEHKRCEVHIVECKEFKHTIDNMLKKANTASFLKSSSWAEQFKEAFQVEAGGDDDDNDEAGDVEPSYFDYVMHYLCLFWKILFAFVPPTDIAGGWACFVVAILMIGLLTTVTGDIASHFGCTVGLADSVVAISFVALGTSLPGRLS